MNDQEIDAMLTAAAVRDEHVASLPLSDLVTELRERTLMAGDQISSEQRMVAIPPKSARRRHVGPRLALAAAALMVIAGVVMAAAAGPDTPGEPGPTTDEQVALPYPAELVSFAESSPRLLLRADGWEITQVEEPWRDRGQGLQFFGLNGAVGRSGPGDTLELLWHPADRAGNLDAPEVVGDITIAGQPARLSTEPSNGSFVAWWIQGGLAVQLLGFNTTEHAYRALVGTIEAVDVDTWLAALPGAFVRPDERDAVIADLQRDIPVPAGFDASVWDDIGVNDRRTIGRRVTGTIACAWIEQYEAAVAVGDSAAEQAAVEALAGTRDWPALQEMVGESGFPAHLWQIADRIVTTGVVGPRGGPDWERGIDAEGYVGSLCPPPPGSR